MKLLLFSDYHAVFRLGSTMNVFLGSGRSLKAKCFKGRSGRDLLEKKDCRMVHIGHLLIIAILRLLFSFNKATFAIMLAVETTDPLCCLFRTFATGPGFEALAYSYPELSR
jgi:hypothetical protein